MADKAFNVCSFNNFSSRYVRRLFMDAAWPGRPLESRRRLLALLNCDRIVMVPELEDALAFGVLDSARLGRLREPMPRAYVVGGLEVFDDQDKAMLFLTHRPFDPWEVAIIDRPAMHGDSFAGLRPRKVRHEIRRLTYRPNGLDIDVYSEAPGLLVISDAFYPGWTATVNGKETPIYKVNGAFRGVRISEGTHLVKMDYSPRSLPIGVAVSLTTLALMLILLIPRWRRSGSPGSSTA
jgi:hypothetical protein